ncbi:MAG TPA: class I SAM-dependent methyltransferase [Anaerolineales bacterium]|nr:class I SAM-dependent methyltransferase [Anaerolineales bacterium]
MSFFHKLTFNFWYYSKPPWDSGVTPPELFEFIRSHPAGRAIDLGCGTGTNIISLAKSGWQVTGIDFASRAIQMAKRKLKKANITARLITGDVTNFKVDSQFDLALDIGCFHSLENKADYLTQLDKILAPKGFWLMYGFFKPASNLPAPGFVESDIQIISARALTLLSRRDGFDKKERPSAWFLFQKK